MKAVNSLEEVRSEIDALDQQLLQLLAKRQQWVHRAGELKPKGDDNAVRAPDRVNAVIAARREAAVEIGLSPEVAEAVWRAMIDAFIAYELEVNQ